MKPTPQQARAPRYRLTEAAYIDDRLRKAGDEIEFEGVPGYHMEPINAEAKRQVEKFAPKHIDPIRSLTIISKSPD